MVAVFVGSSTCCGNNFFLAVTVAAIAATVFAVTKTSMYTFNNIPQSFVPLLQKISVVQRLNKNLLLFFF